MKVIFPSLVAGKIVPFYESDFPIREKLKCFYSFLLIPRNQEIT